MNFNNKSFEESSDMRETLRQNAESKCNLRMTQALDLYERRLLELKTNLLSQWKAEEEVSRLRLTEILKNILDDFQKEIESTL